VICFDLSTNVVLLNCPYRTFSIVLVGHLSSPAPLSLLDFRSSFDDSTPPDFSDLTSAFFESSDELPAVDLMGYWSNDEFEVLQPLSRPTAVDAARSSLAPTRAGEKRTLRDDSHILVSLLKRPKAELDWITTGQQPPPAVDHGSGTVCGGSDVVGGLTLDVVDRAASGASPLQRLKALTHSDVVNHYHISEPATSTRTPTVIVSLPAAVPVGMVNGLLHDARSLVVRRQTSASQPGILPAPPPPVSQIRSAPVTVISPRQGSVHHGAISQTMTGGNGHERRRSSASAGQVVHACLHPASKSSNVGPTNKPVERGEWEKLFPGPATFGASRRHSKNIKYTIVLHLK